MNVRLQKAQARFKRVRTVGEPNSGIGEFFFLIDIAAGEEAVYIPLSIASGKKPTGFVYQIEGTAEGAISTTDISASGAGVTKLTVGTIVYCKIPPGKTATIRILVEMRGQVGKTYTIILSTINYKRNPNDARYQKFTNEIRGKSVKFN